MSKDVDGIKSVLMRMANKWGVDHPVETARLFATWERIVGPAIASRCQPTSFKIGVLKVKTSSQAWAAQFRYIAPELIIRLNKELGIELVTEIKAWVGEQKGGTTREPDTRSDDEQPQMPVSNHQREADEADAKKMVSAIADERLAETTKRALLAAKMRRKRG